MFCLNDSMRYFLCPGYTDMRKGMFTLCGLVHERMGVDVATKVSVQLQLTDPDLKSRDRVVKKTEKDSLYAAMDVASVWLERALANP